MAVKDKVIINTRPKADSDQFDMLLREAEAEVYNFPMISLNPVESDKAYSGLNKYYGIIFTSPNAAKFFLKGLKEKYTGRIYAVGERTASVIKSFDYDVYTAPDKYNAEELVKVMDKNELKNKRLLFPTGTLSMRTIVNALKDYVQVDELVIYETKKPYFDESYNKLKELLVKNQIDCLAFFSPSAVDNFIDFTKGTVVINIDIAVIGETTKERALSQGMEVNIIPVKATAKEMAKEIIKYYNT